MMSKMIWFLIGVLLSLTMLSLSSCGGGGGNVTPQVNHPPEIIGIDEQGGARPLASPGAVVIRLNVTDEDGDDLTITATPSAGNITPFSGDANRFIYVSPTGVTTAMTADVALTASDGHGGTDTAHWTVDVIPPVAGNSKQTSLSISLQNDPTITGDTVVATCNVVDPDGDTQVFTYLLRATQPDGYIACTFNETAPGTVRFEAPGTTVAKTYDLHIYADDGNGHCAGSIQIVHVVP